MSILRPFRWHDLPFIYRLAGRGTSFDTHLGLIVGEDHLRHAQLTGTGRTQVFVLRRRRGSSGMAVLYYPIDDQHARLAYIAPSLEDADEDLWLEMLDGLTVCAGSRGTFNIAAEVEEHSPALEILRQSDFAIYARQDIWARQPAAIEAHKLELREARPEDIPALIGLYGMLVPPLIKQVEQPPPFAADGCYLLDGRDGPSAMVAYYKSNHRALAEIYLHPEVDLEAREVINSALALLGAETQLVYIRLRRYIGWLDGALDDLGFEKISSQAVMVRHMTVRAALAQQNFKPLPVMDSMLVPAPITEEHGLTAAQTKAQ